MSKPLKIVHVASEVYPFSKTGGLADVARSLPKAVKLIGHDVTVITPLYQKIVDIKKYGLKMIHKDIRVELSKDVALECNIWKAGLMKGLPVYFIENQKYFGMRKSIYGSKWENARFMFFDLAALKLLKVINLKPDVIHCHDWHTGLIPYFLKGRYKNDEYWKNTSTLFTIHNLLFQLGHPWWSAKGGSKDDGYAPMPKFGHSKKIEGINFAKRAIINADIINTVSEQYAKEILTKDFGEHLQRVLKNRKDRVFGIVNGIDYNDFNPKTDPGLYRNYSVNSLNKKARNKQFIQKYFHLPERADVPVLGMVTRIAEQKGFDLIMKIIEDVLELDIQFVIMGSGDKQYESSLRKLQKNHPKKVGTHLKFNAQRATSVYAGSDMFLMPSRFEPCGLGQLISLRYGSVPIVRAVGGLSDTVSDFNPKTKKGNGFVFHSYSAKSLMIAVVRAIETYKYGEVWDDLVKKGMRQVFSWEIPAKKYLALYRKAIKHRKKNGNNKS